MGKNITRKEFTRNIPPHIKTGSRRKHKKYKPNYSGYNEYPRRNYVKPIVVATILLAIGVGGFLLRSANMTQNLNDVYVVFDYIGDAQGISSDVNGFTVTEAGIYNISWGCLTERDAASGAGQLDLVLYLDGVGVDTVWMYWAAEGLLRDNTMSRHLMQELAVGDTIRLFLDNQPTNTDVGNIFLVVHKI